MRSQYVLHRIVVVGSAIVCAIMAVSAFAAETATLRILVWEGMGYEQYQAPFLAMVKEKHDIDLKLEYTYVNDYEDFFPALRDGTADIVSPDHHLAKDERFQFIKLKLVLPLNLDNIPNFTHLLPALQQPDFWTEDGAVYGIPGYRGTYGLAYNTQAISTAPTSWNILWDPQYQDKYIIGNQYEYNVYLTALASGLPPAEMSDYPKLNVPDFQAKLGQLAVNAHTIWDGVDQPEQYQEMSLAAGWGVALPQLNAAAETWKMADMQEGTPGYVCVFMLGHTLEANPTLRQIAEEWLNYMISDELQASNIRDMATLPVTTSVNAQLTPEEIMQFHLDDPAYFEKHVILAPTLSKTDRKGLQRLWEKALQSGK